MGFFESRHGGLARCIFYILLLLWSILLFVLCCARLGYTTQFRDEPSLNGGRPFYDPSVVELLVCSILGAIFSMMILNQLWYRKPNDRLAKNWFEVGGLAILWLLWLGGAGAATTVWPDLSWCIQYSPCILLQFLMAFAWLGWLTQTALLLITLYLHKTRGVEWNGLHFDTWGHKEFGSNNNYMTQQQTAVHRPTPIILAPKGERESERGWGRSRAGSTRLEDEERGSGSGVPPEVPAKESEMRGKRTSKMDMLINGLVTNAARLS